jgi:hypothetical protein
MSPRHLTVAAALTAALVQAPALAQSRPDEEALFGGPPESPPDRLGGADALAGL